MLALVGGFVAAFAIPPIAEFFSISPPDFTELLVVIGSLAIAIGVLGALGFRAPLFLRALIRRSDDLPT